MDTVIASRSIPMLSQTSWKSCPARRATWLVQTIVVLAFCLVAGAATAQTFPNPLINTAQVTHPTDTATGNNTATDSNALAATAALSVAKTLLTPSPVPAGGAVSYQIVVSNAGPSTAVDATVADTVPPELTNVSWTCVASSPASSCSVANGTGNINLPVSVAPGDTITIVVTGTAPLSGTVGANTVTITPGPGTTDPDPTDNTSTVPPVPVAAISNLSVVKTLTSASPAPAGSAVTYQIVVSNSGPSDAIGAAINDIVPAELTNVSWTCVAAGTSSCGTPNGTGNTINLTANVGVGAGNTVTINVTGTAPASGTIGANTVTVTPPGGTTDPDPGDNTSTTPPIPVAAVSNLSVAKTLTSASPAPAGSTVTYQIVVSNSGPSDAIGATISDTVPSELTNVSWTCVAAGTSSCGTPNGTGNTINLTANVGVGAGNTVTINVTGTAPASGTIGANTVTVTPPGGTTDPDPGDNTSTTPPVPVTPIVSIDSASAAEGDAVVFTVSLSGASTTDVTVTLNTADATATGGIDYTAQTALTVTIPAGSTSTTVSVPTTEDLVFEGDETFTATLSAPVGAVLGTATGTGTITDDDAQPTVSINSASAPEGDVVTFTVSLSNPSANDVTVVLDTADVSATAPADYTAQTALTVTIAAGSTSTTVNVPTIEDTLFEGDETFTATIGSPSGATISNAIGTGTITEDDAAPTLGINDVSVDESAGTASFTVTLSGASALPVTVDYATANGTAVAGSDYTAVNGTLTFAPGVLTQTIAVPITDDAIFEGDENYTVGLSNAAGATIADNSGLGTITDNETIPVVSIDSPSAAEGDTMVFTVSLSNPSAADVTVELNTANGTASAPGDYTAQSGITVTIPAGSTSATVNAPTIEDTLFEGNETFTATISNPVGATIGTPTGTATITEDDLAPIVSIGNASALEGDPVVFTISLSNPSATDVTVTLNTANGSATAPADYTAQSGVTVTVPAGSASATVNVLTIEDTLFEGDETFTATISNPTGATIGTATGTGTITDDDAQPTVSVDSPTAAEGDPMVFTVSLSNASTTDVTVSLDTANGTAAAPGDYTAQTALIVTIPAGSTSATVNVPTIEDTLFEGNETFTATISNPTGATIGTGTGTATIIEDDAQPVVSIAGTSAGEGSPIAFTVSLSGASATDVSVTLNTADGTAVAPGDYTAQSALTVTIPAGSTNAVVNVPTTDDAVFEGDETFTATISAPIGATLGTATATGTITENDAAPVLSVADATVTEGATAQVVVSLSSPSATDVTVVLTTTDGTATAPADYTAQPGITVTIPAGQGSTTVSIPTAADNLFEGNENFTVTLGNPVGATLGDDTATVTITDDEAQPVASIDSPSAAEGDTMVFTVSLSNPSATGVTIALNTADGTATTPADYTAQSGITVTIPAGSTSAIVNVPTIEDTLFEGNETFTATISSPVGATIGTATGTATITEDDALPTVSINSASAPEGDAVVFTVSLSNPSATDVTVALNTADGSATAPGDYTAQAAITVTIPAGSTSATVSVPTIEDALFEGDETFTATISSPVGATIGTATGTGTITDDDTAPTLSVADATVIEGGIAQVVVSLSSPSATGVTVVLTTTDGTATSPADYTTQPGITVTIPAGQTSTTVPVPTAADSLFEGDETFTVTLTNPVGATLGDGTATVTITDDETAPVVSIAGATAVEGSAVGFAVNLSTASATDVTVVLTTTDGTATSPADYTAQSGITVTIPAGQTSVTAPVPTVDDTLFEGDETFTATLSSPTGATLGTATATGTITENDAAPVLNVADVTVAEGDIAQVVVSLSSPSATDVTVAMTTSDGTATAPADYTAQSGVTVTIPATQTSTTAPIPTAADGVFEGDETFAITLSNPNGATLGDAIATATIQDAQQQIIATPDSGTIGGANGGTVVPNVLANDSLGGSTATPSTVTLTQVSSTHPNLTLDTSTGAVNVAPGTPAGNYTLTYQICEIASPSNCATATVTVTVTPAGVVANGDAGTVASTGGTAVANVLANDTVDGATATTTTVILSQLASSSTNVSLDPATGAVNVAAGTAAGNYTLTYQICERLNPANCATATVAVTVTAVAIIANDDTAGPVNGSTGGTAVVNVLTNDTSGGTAVNPADITLTPTNAGPITINPDGTVDIAPNTPAGTYTASYQICENANPGNCDGATVTVTVAAAAIDAADDDARATPVDGTNGGTAVSNVLANDTLGGAAATTTSVLPSLVSSSNAGVTFDPGTGAVSVASNTAAGTHTLTYRICERLNPANCDTAIVTVAVTAAVIDALDDNAGPVDGVAGGTAVINVLDNDLLDGNVITPASVTLAATPAGPLEINGDGTLDVAPQTPSGTYTAAYRICQNLNPANCDGATATVVVTGDPLAVRLSMRAVQRRVKVGDLVRYIVTAENTGTVAARNTILANSIPAGFSYVDGSLVVDDDDDAGNLAGTKPLSIAGLDISPGRQATISYDLRAGAGVGPGIHTNRAVLQSVSAQPISNMASADVEVVGDPLLEDSLIVGSVFDDRNGNGTQQTGERGVPGVRIASIEGLIVETDAFGRYHLVGIPAGASGRGRLFILKVDPSTLPDGTTFTTENPRVRRITPGLPVRFDFGVKLPDGALGCGRGQANIELGDVIFARNSAEIPAGSSGMLDRLAATVREHCGGQITIVARADAEPLAFRRAQAVQGEIARRLDAKLAAQTRIDVTTEVEPLEPLISLDQAIALSQLLFDTDKADIRPQYHALIRQVADAINERGHGELRIDGHADARGRGDYNEKLGMRRARAVFDAIAAELKPEVRNRLRVETSTGAVAGVETR